MERPITDEEMISIENQCNQLIRENKGVKVEMLKDKSELRAGCKGNYSYINVRLSFDPYPGPIYLYFYE